MSSLAAECGIHKAGLPVQLKLIADLQQTFFLFFFPFLRKHEAYEEIIPHPHPGYAAHAACLVLIQHLFGEASPIRPQLPLDFGLLLRFAMPGKIYDGAMAAPLFSSAEPAGDVIIRRFLGRIRKDPIGFIVFYDFTHIEKSGFVRYACCLMHIMGNDNNAEILFKLGD
jgi:hypothetical protein